MFANKDIVPDWDMVNVIDFLIRDVGGSEPNLLSTDLFRFTINEHQPYVDMGLRSQSFPLLWIDPPYIDATICDHFCSVGHHLE
jgi:hypothetical protein